MRYENFLFTRSQRQDFTAFVRPALLTNKDVSAVGGIFNYVTDISRLTPEFPSLYCFPLGEYLLLLRHYNSGRRHAGRAIGVIEGIAVRRVEHEELASALPEWITHQRDLLNVIASVEDIETLDVQAAVEQEWHGQSSPAHDPLADALLERGERERLFLPFTERGRELLIGVVADPRIVPSFAFGANGDVLEQLEQLGRVNIASFFNTARPCFRSRTTHRITRYIEGYQDEAPAIDPSMALRPIGGEMRLRPEPLGVSSDEPEANGESEGISIRSGRKRREVQIAAPEVADDAASEPAVLTMRQTRDRILAEEAAAREPAPDDAGSRLDPIHWLIRLVGSLVSPHPPK